jgi:hypothetical protein
MNDIIYYKPKCDFKNLHNFIAKNYEKPAAMETMICLPTEREKVLKAWKLIEAHFKGDGHKANVWFKTKNPLLGDVSPYWMIYVGRIDKLLAFIETQLSENERHEPSEPHQDPTD